MVWRGDTAPGVWCPEVGRWQTEFGPEEDKKREIVDFSLSYLKKKLHFLSESDRWDFEKGRWTWVKQSLWFLLRSLLKRRLFRKHSFVFSCNPQLAAFYGRSSLEVRASVLHLNFSTRSLSWRCRGILMELYMLAAADVMDKHDWESGRVQRTSRGRAAKVLLGKECTVV